MADYRQTGSCIVKDGSYYFTKDYLSVDGTGYGCVYKDERAFREDPKAVCYIPEHAFDDAEPVLIDGVECYPAEALDLYSREMLERMIEGERDCDTGEPIDIDYFFWRLEWAYPSTYLTEMAA